MKKEINDHSLLMEGYEKINLIIEKIRKYPDNEWKESIDSERSELITACCDYKALSDKIIKRHKKNMKPLTEEQEKEYRNKLNEIFPDE
jgi:hypothetical protein